jgi:hypothetical protein
VTIKSKFIQMKKIKIVLGVSWAIISLIVILVLFPGLNSFSSAAAKLPFMKINPRYSGGDPAFEKISVNCTLIVRKPVFSGLLRERKSGFVQLDWRGQLPGILYDTIDYDSDKSSDFVIKIDPINAQSSLFSLNPSVVKIDISSRTSYGWAVRVKLLRK